LHREDSNHVAPLPIGNLTTRSKRAELSQDLILGGANPKRARRILTDQVSPTPFQLATIQQAIA
jgi:hypothetical protein